MNKTKIQKWVPQDAELLQKSTQQLQLLILSILPSLIFLGKINLTSTKNDQYIEK